MEIVFSLSIVASAAAMYGYVRSLAGRSAGLLAAVVYTYAPYHLMVLYVRANLAESMAFVWLPLCLWSFRACVRRPSLWAVIGAALAYAGLILTSNLVWVLFTPVLMLYILVLLWQETGDWGLEIGRFLRGALTPLAGSVAGLGLSAIFWLPMLLERKYVRMDQWFDGRYNFRDDFLSFFQFFSPHWDFGVSLPGPNDTLSFQIGPVLLLFALLGGLFAWRRYSLRPEIAVFAVTGLGAAALGWSLLAPLWDWPLVGSILQAAQFPWRWLPLTTVGFSVLAGLLLVPDWGPEAETDALSLPVFVVVAVTILASYPLLQIQTVPPAEGPVGLAALMRFERDADEMTGSTAWVKEIPTWSPMAEYYINLDEAGQPVSAVTSKVDYEALDYSKMAVGSVAHNSVMEEVYFCTDPGDRPGVCGPRDDQHIVFNHFYYPGWRAWLLDGSGGQRVQELPIIPESTGTLGRITVPVPPTGEGFILLRYGDTLPRIVGQWISLATLLLLLGSVVLIARKEMKM